MEGAQQIAIGCCDKGRANTMSGLTRFDFYPRDWFLDTRDLSDRAKGCYIDLLAAMYNRGGPLPYDEKYLCKLSGYSHVRSLRHVLKELLNTDKLRIVDGELVNNRVQEELKTAHRRQKIATAGGQAKALQNLKTSPKPRKHVENTSKSNRKVAEQRGDSEKNQHVNLCSPSPSPSPSKKKDTLNDHAFDGFWRIYPSRRPHSNPKKPAREKFEAALKRGVPASDIIRGAENYAVYVERETADPRFIAQAVTWLNQERWAEYQEAPEEVRPEVAPL